MEVFLQKGQCAAQSWVLLDHQLTEPAVVCNWVCRSSSSGDGEPQTGNLDCNVGWNFFLRMRLETSTAGEELPRHLDHLWGEVTQVLSPQWFCNKQPNKLIFLCWIPRWIPSHKGGEFAVFYSWAQNNLHLLEKLTSCRKDQLNVVRCLFGKQVFICATW